MERTEWPTEKRLASLRSEGIVPLSSVSLRCLAAVIIFSAVYFSLSSFEVFLGVKAYLTSDDPTAVLGFSGILAGYLLQNLLVLSLSLFVLLLLWGLFQTRFLFRFGSLSFQASRLNPFRHFSIGDMFWRVVLVLATFVIGLVSGVVLLALGLGPLLAVLNRGGREPLAHMNSFVPWLFFPAMCILLASGAFAFFLRKRLFLRSHRMTRREVEQER